MNHILLHCVMALVLLFTPCWVAPMPLLTARLNSVHTGFYVQVTPDGTLSATAGDLAINDSTRFIVEPITNECLSIRRVNDLSSYLSLQESADTGTVTFNSVSDEGSGDLLVPSHTVFEYAYVAQSQVFSTVLRVRHSNGNWCYLAFEEDGSMVDDPCDPNLNIFKARVKLIPLMK